MTKNKGGRPTKFTPETIAKLEEAFLLGCTDLEACLMAKVSKTALYEYQHKYPEFVERKEQLKSNPFLVARTSVMNAMESDGKLAFDYLKHTKRGEFAERKEHTGADGQAIETKVEFDTAQEAAQAYSDLMKDD